ncbi:MAG: transcription elongation factor GreAB [Verrucomicrobiota bacterium]
MKKDLLLKKILAQLNESLDVLDNAAKNSRAEATHESSKAESKYDTRGLEAGYLASGQARQAREILESIKTYETLSLRTFTAKDPVDLTALVELDLDGLRSFFFIGPKNGGLEIEHSGHEITVITPQSPLGEQLMGKVSGQRWTAKRGNVSVKHHLLSVS